MAIKKTKARNFAFIIYPESIPSNWVSCLEDLGVAMAVSPLHDLDQKEDDLSETELELIKSGVKVYKKPHYHVLYIARNPVTVESVRNKIKRKLGNNSVSHIEIIDFLKGSYEYLTHESKKKNKHVYDKKDLLHINGFDIDRYVTLDESEKRELKNLLLEIIRKKHLVNVIHLLDFIELNGAEYGIENISSVHDVVTSNASGFRLYFDANYQDGYRRNNKFDVKTGEIKQ